MLGSLLKKGKFLIKDKNSQAVRFIRNNVQRDYNLRKSQSGKRKRVIVKARQMGFTTDSCLNMLDKAMTRPYYSGFIVADDIDNVKKIFQEKIKFPFESLPSKLRLLYKTVRDNANEFRFANPDNFDSYVRVGTSARGTTVEDLHVTEAGLIGSSQELWTEVVTGSFNASQDITLEGTADGLNLFYDKVMEEMDDPDSEWDIYFYNWTWANEYSLPLPYSNKWIEEYRLLAKRCFLEPFPETKFNLTWEQFYWYYIKAKDQKELMVQEYPFTIDEAFKSSGNSIFNKLDLEEALAQVKQDYWLEEGVQIWHRPEVGKIYTIGVDPVAGEGNDEACISIWDFQTCEQVAEISDKLKPEEASLIAKNLGLYYNNALIAVENNGVGIATLNELLKLNYPNVYTEIDSDPRNPRSSSPKYGWSTNAKTKPVMMTGFRKMFENKELKINSKKLLNQMKTYVRKVSGKIEHEEGKHDDCLLSAFIAIEIRKSISHQRGYTL